MKKYLLSIKLWDGLPGAEPWQVYNNLGALYLNAENFDRALVSLFREYGIEDELPRLGSERRLSDRIIKLLISLLPHQALRRELRGRFLT